MTLLMMEGFDHYTTAQTLDKFCIAQQLTIGSSYGRFGGQGCRLLSYNYFYNFDFKVNKSTIYLGFAIKKLQGTIAYVSSYPLVNFLDESDVAQVKLHLTSDFGISAYDGTDTLLGSSSDNIFPDVQWNYLEAKVTISATVGIVEVKINENQVLNLTSQDTKNGSDYIRRISLTGIYPGRETHVDDLYVDDAQFHGDCRVKTFMPDSISSTNNDFTASAGNKDDCVDEAQSNDDTDYIYSDTLNDKQTFGITTGSLGTVKGVQLNNHCRLDQAGTRKITPLIRSNSTNYSGTETDVIPADFKFESEVWETDPDDSNAWTQTKLEAAEFGLEITT